jgi:hypothetical protein
MRSPETKPRRWILWLVLPVATLASLWGCKGKKKKPARPRNACSAASLKETRQWLADLCAAHDQVHEPPNHHWWGLPLARADVKLVKKLPRGVLVTLTPRKLLINGKPAPDWPKPAGWVPPDMSRGIGSLITRLLPKLRRTLGTSASISTAKSALRDLERRSAVGVGASRAVEAPRPQSSRDKDLPSGLTVLTLITAKQQLTGRGPRWVHLAIGPRVLVRQVVQLQTLLALAGFDGVHLLFTPRTAPDAPLPPAPRVYEALGAIGPVGDSRARRAARHRALRLEERRWELQGCDAMTRLRATLRKAPPAQRCQLLQDQLPDTFRRCKCPLDERPLLSLWLAVLGPMDHVGSKSVRLYPRAKAVEAKADAIWSEVADGVVSRPGRHLWIKLR